MEVSKAIIIYRMVVQHELHLLQFDKLADTAIAHWKVIQQL